MSLSFSDDSLNKHQKLAEHESYLRGLIEGDAPNSVILGFLPVTETVQDEIVSELRASIIPSLASLLGQFPAVTAYGLALARAKADEDGKKFWDCVEEGTGKRTSVPAREDLSKQFQFTCRSLGLKTGEIGQKHNIAPFIFQAGIMYFWERGENAYLSNGYRTTIKTMPIPSADDWDRCRNFAHELASHCYGSQNLKNILNDDLGALLVQRLVRYYEGDELALPPHLREVFKKERKEGRKLRLPSPFLIFDRFQNEFLLILPAVQSSLADESSTWEWNGNKYFASHERAIPLKESQLSEHQINLKSLLKNYQDQAFKVDASLNSKTPFRIFNCGNGRERISSAGRTSELPAGAYHIVAHNELHAGDDDELFVDQEKFRLCNLEEDEELRPGDPALKLRFGQVSYQVSCQITAGFFMGNDCSQSLALRDGSRVHWGSSFDLSGYLPVCNSTEEQITLEINSPSLPSPHVKTLEPVHQGNALQFTEELNDPLLEAISQFPPGIHQLEIILRQGQNRATRKLFYWKELTHVNETTGFYCSTFPENINLPNSSGVKQQNSNLLFNGNKSPFFSLSLKDGAKLEFSRPGVRITIIDEHNEREALDPSIKSIVVARGDKRRLAFQSGGFQSWNIRCGTYDVGSLNHHKTTHTASIASILSEGGNGSIVALSRDRPEDPPIHLIRLYTPVSCKQPKYYLSSAGDDDSWHFSFSTDGLNELGVRIYDLSDEPALLGGEVTSLSKLSDDFAEQTVTLAPGISIRAIGVRTNSVSCKAADLAPLLDTVLSASRTNIVKLSLKIDNEKSSHRFYLIDILHQESDCHEWEFAHARENNGLSLLRFPIFGSALPDGDSPWWHFVRHSRQTQRNPDLPDIAFAALSKISSEQLDRALTTCQRLLNFQYPRSVWTNEESRHQAKWFENWAMALADKRLLANREHAPIWWRNASYELDDFTRIKNSPVSKNFLFGTSREILFSPPFKLDQVESQPEPPSLSLQSLQLGHSILRAESVSQFAQKLFSEEEESLCRDTFYFFQNFGAVSSGRALAFEQFNFCSYLDSLTRKLEEEELADGVPLLSAAHLSHCCRTLSQRTRLLEHTSNEQKTQGLSILTTQLQAAHSRITRASPLVAEHLHLEREFITHRTKDSSHKEYQKHWTPPALSNLFARRVADLLWCLTATSRLAAHGRISQKDADHVFDIFFVEANEKLQPLRVSTLLSFGPELFAFYVALFDFAFAEPLTQ